MAKATEITRDWDKTTAALDAAIKKTDLKQVKVMYEYWEDLLEQAKKKASKWDEGDPKLGEKFKAYVKGRESKAPRYKDELKKLEGQSAADAGAEKRAKVALTKLKQEFKTELDSKFKEAEECILQAQFAFVRENPKAIKYQYKIARRLLLEDIPGMLSPAGVQELIKKFTAQNKLSPGDLTPDDELKKLVATGTAHQKELWNSCDTLEDKVQELEEEKKKQAEHTDASATPEYKLKLKQSFNQFRAVYDEAKKDLAKTKELSDEFSKLFVQLTRVDSDGLVDAVRSLTNAGTDLFKTAEDVEIRLERELAIPNNVYLKNLEKAGITKKDIERNFKPAAVKAGVMLKQCEALRNSALNQAKAAAERLKSAPPEAAKWRTQLLQLGK